jgi:hypothetical protein
MDQDEQSTLTRIGLASIKISHLSVIAETCYSETNHCYQPGLCSCASGESANCKLPVYVLKRKLNTVYNAALVTDTNNSSKLRLLTWSDTRQQLVPEATKICPTSFLPALC